MFQRANNRKKEQPKAGDENVRQEARLEEQKSSVQPMGNEAANSALMDQMLDELTGNNDPKPGLLDLREDFIPYDGGDERIEIPPELPELNDSDYLNSSHNIVNDDWLERIGMAGRNKGNGKSPADNKNIISDAPKKSKKKRKKRRDINNLISNEISEGSDSEHNISTGPKEETDKKPDREDAKNALELAEDILKDAPQEKAPEKKEKFPSLSTYAPDPDTVTEVGVRKEIKKKGKKSPKNEVVPTEAHVENLEGIEDARWKDAAADRLMKVELEGAGPEEVKQFRADEMEKLKNWNFSAQKLDKLKSKPSKFRRFLTYFAAGMGKLLGMALRIVTLGHFWRLKSTARFAFTDSDKWQLKKDYQNIPGWNGAQFDPQADTGKDVLADFRRVPTVWSHLTAAKAAETVHKDGREEEKPLDPVVSVMIDQPKSQSEQAMRRREMGHAMIGIEYSRKSAISNRYERYDLRYGFYPAKGTTTDTWSGGITELWNNAVLPGILKDDYTHYYDVSRRYPAKPEQVNAIIEASEKYAEGGYSLFDRNCTTFVKEMVVNKAHLATGGDIFEQSEVDFSHWGNFGMFGASAFQPNAKAGTETALMDLASEQDETYQNYGNKRVTKTDWVRYKKSMKKGSSVLKQTFVPGRIGERLRRMEGEQAGEIGSYKYLGRLKGPNDTVITGLDKIYRAVDICGSNIQEQFNNDFPEDQMDSFPFDLRQIIDGLNMMGDPLNDLDVKVRENVAEKNKDKEEKNKLKRDKVKEYYFLTPDELRAARDKLSENIGLVNILLFNYFKNDKRLNQPLLELISLLNIGIRYVDDLYDKSARGGLTEEFGETKVTDLRDELTHNRITVRAGGKDASFTPTLYEAYIQVYKDPKTAVESYKRLEALRRKKTAAGKWTDSFLSTMKHRMQSTINAEDENQLTYAEARELKKLERLDELAQEFVLSHRYMIEKDAYKQQDIDYAFQLHDKEIKGLQVGEQDVEDPVRHKYKGAGGIYITLILDKFFHDLMEVWMKSPEEGGLSDDEAADYDVVQPWMDEYLADRINRNKDGFEAVVRGIYRSIRAADPDKTVEEKDVMKKLSNAITETCVNRRFETDPEPKAAKGYISLSGVMTLIPKDRSSKFTKIVSDMFVKCDLEDSDLEMQIK